MPGIPHPQGPEYGTIYSTPEEARVSNEGPVITIPLQDFLEALEDPKTQALLAHARRLNESKTEFMKEIAPTVIVVDHHLARRAGMYSIDGGNSSES